jgi:hypothetical protein
MENLIKIIEVSKMDNIKKLRAKDLKILWLVENTSKVNVPEGESRIPLLAMDTNDLSKMTYEALYEEAKCSEARAEEMTTIFTEDKKDPNQFDDLGLDDLYVMPLAKHKRGLAACCQVLNFGVDFDATFILRNKVASVDNRLRAAEGFDPQNMLNYADSLEGDAKVHCTRHDIGFERLEKAVANQEYMETYPGDELDVFILLDTVAWLRYWAGKGYGIITHSFIC